LHLRQKVKILQRIPVGLKVGAMSIAAIVSEGCVRCGPAARLTDELVDWKQRQSSSARAAA
jgi:hypothetical protein